MKKTLLLVFSAAILFCANTASAQTAGVSSSAIITDGTTTVTTDGTGTIRPLGGEWAVTVIVSDLSGHPIAGALVTATCTGLAAQYTNTAGTATWSGTGGCPCTAAQATVQTATCNQKVKISCGTSLVTCQ